MRIIVLALAGSLAGCALITAKGPDPMRARGEAPDCNTGKGGVAADGIIAGLLAATTIGLAESSNNGPAVGTALIGALYAGSALYGNSTANHCRVARDEYDALQEQLALDRAQLADQDDDEEQRPSPPPSPAPAPAPSTSHPAPSPPPAPAPPPPPSTSTSTPADDDSDGWSDFWQEVPR